MIDNELKEQLKQYLSYVEKDIIFELSAGEDENSKEVREFVEDVVSLTDQFTIEEKDLPYTPSFGLKTKDREANIFFAGVPLGHEFESFVLALLQMGGVSPKIEESEKKRIASVTEPVKLETIASLTCTNCPDVVQAFNAMAVLNENIQHTMIEGSMFQELVEGRKVMAVPSIFKDGEFIDAGKKTLHQLLDLLAGEVDASAFEDLPTYDQLIIGGGPAGATAAIYGARKGIKVGIIADDFGGQVTQTLSIENIPGFVYTEGEKFMAQMREQVDKYEVDVHNGVEAEKIDRNDNLVKVTLTNGAVIGSKTVIIATGARWRLIGIPGEIEYKNKGVAYCPHCDGPLFKGKSVAVIGGGNSGIEAAIDLAGMVKDVTVFEFLPTLKADEVLQEKLHSLENVTVHTNAQTTELFGDDTLKGIKYTDRETGEEHTVDVEGCFIQVGLVPNTEWCKETIDQNERGEILVGKEGETNLEGVFAAGDCTDVVFKQIVISAGTGATASLGAFNYIMRN